MSSCGMPTAAAAAVAAAALSPVNIAQRTPLACKLSREQTINLQRTRRQMQQFFQALHRQTSAPETAVAFDRPCQAQ